MRALVTGASGFLGRHLVSALRANGSFVVGLIRDADSAELTNTHPNAAVYGCFDQVERTLAEYEVDTVFHLAAQTQVSTAVAHPMGTMEANIQGTWTVLEACRRQGIPRVIIASSDKVYGDGETPYTEKQALLPHGIYATSKACADLLAQSYAMEFGMSVAVTRCGNLYGPGHTNWSTLIPGTIRSVLRGESPRLRSTGGPRRDFLYVADAVEGYLKLAASSEVGPFNFGTQHGLSVMHIVSEILTLMKSDLKPIIEPSTEAIEIKEQVLICSRAKSTLDWKPAFSLTDGLAKTIEWYREHLKELS